MFRSLTLALCLVSSAAIAQEPAAPSDATVRELLEITRSRELVDGMRPQLESVTRQAIGEAVDLSQLSPGQARILDEMQAEMIDVFVEDMAWEVVEPDFIAIYKASFTEEELRGMIEFYSTELGQTMIRKMPMVMEQTMGMLGQQMQRAAPRLQDIQTRAIERMRSCCADEKVE